ncbi:MAG: hypothetical protein WD423_04235 [Rhodothermales bacterium]
MPRFLRDHDRLPVLVRFDLATEDALHWTIRDQVLAEAVPV